MLSLFLSFVSFITQAVQGLLGDLNWSTNIILPIIGGVIGGSIKLVMADIESRKKKKNNPTPKKPLTRRTIAGYLWISGVAGFLIVNLLNQNGTAKEVVPLAVIAGITPIGVVLGQSFMDGKAEDNLLADVKDGEVETMTDVFKDGIDLSENTDEDNDITVDQAAVNKEDDEEVSVKEENEEEEKG